MEAHLCIRWMGLVTAEVTTSRGYKKPCVTFFSRLLLLL